MEEGRGEGMGRGEGVRLSSEGDPCGHYDDVVMTIYIFSTLYIPHTAVPIICPAMVLEWQPELE